MRWRTKFVVTFGLASFLVLGGSAWAEGKFQTIEVYFDRIQIAINGQSTPLSKDSIIYDGSVYVPLKNLSELLGGEVSWDDQTRSVHIDFINDKRDLLYAASQKGLYQYIAMQNNKIMTDLIAMFKTGDTAGMKQVVIRYEDLRALAANMKDANMALTIDKMKAAVALLQSGWDSKNLDDYSIAWAIYYTNADKLNQALKDKLSEKSGP